MFGVERVGLATGDISIRRGADVTIMTTEVYRNMAWRAKTGISSLLNDVDSNEDSVQVDLNKLESAASDERDYSDLSSNSIVVLGEFDFIMCMKVLYRRTTQTHNIPSSSSHPPGIF